MNDFIPSLQPTIVKRCYFMKKKIDPSQGSADRVKVAVEVFKESKKSRLSESDHSTQSTEAVVQYQGRAGNGNLFSFVITFAPNETYTIMIVDGYFEGYKFENYRQFCNFLKQSYDLSKESVSQKILRIKE